MLTILARTFLVFLLVAACSLLLAGATEELENPEATTFNHGLSGRLANSAFLIARLEEKLNETWSRVRQLQTIEDPNEPVQIGENGNSEAFTCPNGERDFRCGTDNFQCVSDLLICDGVPDCLDATDESPELCDDLPVNAGDVFNGSVHWHGCMLLPDHRSTITITSIEYSNAFRARRYLRATMHDYLPGGPIVFRVPGVYNPSLRKIEFSASIVGIAGDCRFKGRDRLECTVFLQESHLVCNNGSLVRMKNKFS